MLCSSFLFCDSFTKVFILSALFFHTKEGDKLKKKNYQNVLSSRNYSSYHFEVCILHIDFVYQIGNMSLINVNQKFIFILVCNVIYRNGLIRYSPRVFEKMFTVK